MQIPCKDHEYSINTKLDIGVHKQFDIEQDEYCFSFAKLRNSNTSAISHAFRYEHFNQGIFIDIFPVDNCNISQVESNYNKIKVLIEEMSCSMRRNNKFLTAIDIERMAKFPIREQKIIFEEMDALARSSNTINSDLSIVAVNTIYDYKKTIINKKDISVFQSVDMYGYNFPVPHGYDNILQTIYGNYMSLPPLEKRGQWHNSVTYNPDVPYITTLKELQLRDVQKDLHPECFLK